MKTPPVTQTMKISSVRAELNTLVNQVYRHETRVVVEKSGIPVAALVSTDDLKRLDELDRERAARAALLGEFREPFKDVPPEEIERQVAIALDEVRAERRAARAAAVGQ
jgi:prevent-host-death family protein